MAEVDVVVVSFNSRERLRGCVQRLSSAPGINVVVVDNASPDRSLEAIADLPVSAVQLESNGGFAHGCNVGWRLGAAPSVLFLNPDARIGPEAVETLVRALEASPGAGAVAPLIRDDDGSLDFSQRRFPRLRTTFAQALFLHRLFPRAPWTDEVVRDAAAYGSPGSPDWVSGAAVLVRRSVLERLDGWDEGFFMYCEDIDLCRRIRSLGLDVRFEPAAVVEHEGGASAPRSALLPVLAASRLRYARKHRSAPGALAERAGVALGALTHLAVGRGGLAARSGHGRALRLALTGRGGASRPARRSAGHLA